MNSVRAETLYTGKSVVQNACLLFQGQKIVRLSRTKEGTLLGTFPVVTPAFIDAHSRGAFAAPLSSSSLATHARLPG